MATKRTHSQANAPGGILTSAALAALGDPDDDAPLLAPPPPAPSDTGEFSDDDDADNDRPLMAAAAAPSPPAAAAEAVESSSGTADPNPLIALSNALRTPVSMLDQTQPPHVAVEAQFHRRAGRLAPVRYDGTIGAPVAQLPAALDAAARRDREAAAASGDERARLAMTRLYGTCPRPPDNGLAEEINRLIKYLRHVPPCRARVAAAIREQIERCIVDRETPARWNDLHQYLRWRSARDDVHYLVQAGWRMSPTHPTHRIKSMPCVNAERCMGFRMLPQLAGCPPGSFMPIGYISKEELAHHYATGQWPEGGAGNVPCIFCTWYIPHYLQCAIPLDRGNGWLPFVMAQSDFNSVGTFHGYRDDCVLRRSGQHDSIVLAPLARWDSNALSVYWDPNMNVHRVDHDRMLVAPMGRFPSLATFSTDVDPPGNTECVPFEVLNVTNVRTSAALDEQARAARPPALPAPSTAVGAPTRPSALGATAAETRTRPEPFFGPGARPQAPKPQRL